MFPLRDDNPTQRTAIVTIFIIAMNVAVWVVAQGMGAEPALSESVCAFGLIPGEIFGRLHAGATVVLGGDEPCRIGGYTWITPLTSMFLHGSWFHILGNMWFLWVFGNNIEDALGGSRYAIFYVLCGLVAAATQSLTYPGSALPMVGASGAIGGVMGAYAIAHPHARVQTLIILGVFIRTVWVPAWLMLGYWFLLQFIGGLPALASEEGGVAFWAHVGGFVAGIALFYVMRASEPQPDAAYRV